MHSAIDSACMIGQNFSHDLQMVYDEFLQVVKFFIKLCITIKTVRLGRHDPDFITLFDKSLLAKRNKLRQRSSIDSADRLAKRINNIVADNLCRRLGKLADAPVKGKWKALKPRKVTDSTNSRTNHLLSEVESVNWYFANISFDPTATTDEVYIVKNLVQQ
jgi:hypothetical protein